MAKKKIEKNESMISMPSNSDSKDWIHTVLAGLILIFGFMSTSWAQWIIVLAAAVIFASGIVSCCRGCKNK